MERWMQCIIKVIFPLDLSFWAMAEMTESSQNSSCLMPSTCFNSDLVEAAVMAQKGEMGTMQELMNGRYWRVAARDSNMDR